MSCVHRSGHICHCAISPRDVHVYFIAAKYLVRNGNRFLLFVRHICLMYVYVRSMREVLSSSEKRTLLSIRYRDVDICAFYNIPRHIVCLLFMFLADAVRQ
jgi:hypothetical protein